MARGGSRGRTYNRDARGRFASGGSTSSGIRRGAPKAGGTLAARSRLARSKQRLAAQSPADTSIRGTLSRRSQKGAVTRAAKAVAEARKASRVRLPGVKPKGVIRKPKGRKAEARNMLPVSEPSIKGTRSPREQGSSRGKSDKKVKIQLRRAKPGGEFGPDGHWYPGGSFINPGDYVGGKPAKGAGGKSSQGSSSESSGNIAARVVRNRDPKPRPLTPPGTGISAQTGMNKTAKKLSDEFFGSNGYLSSTMEKSFRKDTRSPIDSLRYLGALASRVSEKELRSRTAQALRLLSRKNRRDYILDIQDARRSIGMTRFGVPRVNVTDQQLLNAVRFDTAARIIAGQRVSRGRRGGRNSNEEYAWVTNAMLSTSRRRR